MSEAITIRPARKSDATDIAVLVNIAAHGGPAQGWAMTPEAEGTYDPIEVGRLRVLDDGERLNWRHATVAEGGGEVAGMILGFIPPADAPPSDLPPFFVPIAELEREAAGSWYIAMLGVYATWRNRGVGSRLLDVAEQKRSETAALGLSLIIEDVNEGARRLYERRGFAVRSRRRMVKFPEGGPAGEDWLLMVKD